ncbi:MAG: hypothetical protein JST59_00120 [Actinobacteria bacterium]|nr:hypothetical protein [Actinomycetota bacterium]
MERRIHKYDKYLEYLRARNIRREQLTYMSSIFSVWKREYLGVRQLCRVLDTNQYWEALRKGLKEIKAYIKLMDDTYARELILGKYMKKKNEDLKRLALLLFRYKIRANSISLLNFQIEQADKAAEQNRNITVSYAPLIVKAKDHFREFMLLKNSYAKFKKYSR